MKKQQRGELLVQAQVNRGNADAGDAGANVQASALISVLVTHEGEPVDDIGASAGDQVSEVALPAEWTFETATVAAGGCTASVTQFGNQGDGVYSIRIVPFVGNPACAWLSGDYVYVIKVEATRTVDGHATVLRGGTLAKLSIP